MYKIVFFKDIGINKKIIKVIFYFIWKYLMNFYKYIICLVVIIVLGKFWVRLKMWFLLIKFVWKFKEDLFIYN